MYLLWSTCFFAFLAVISGLLTDGGNSSDNSNDVEQTTSTVGAPTTTGVPKQYIVQPGDSLYSIAERFNLSAPALVELNNIRNPDAVPAGTTLLLPPSNGFVPIGATTTMPP